MATKGQEMMKTPPQRNVTIFANLFAVAMAASGAYAANGALTTKDAPGQVLQMSGVGSASAPAPASAQPRAKVTTTATPHVKAKPPFSAKPTHVNVRGKVPSVAKTMPVAVGRRVVGQVARPAPLPAYQPVAPQTTTRSPQPAVPKPMMTAGASTPPSEMH